MNQKRINFKKTARLQNVASCDELKIKLHYIHFEKGFAIATDGLVLVKIKISEISDLSEEQIQTLDGKNLYKSSYASILKYNYILVEEDGIIAYNDPLAKVKFMFSDEEYVDWEKVFNEKLKSKNIPTERIFFDPKLLANVMSCIDSTFVRMTHKGGDHDSAFHITFSDLESEAVLMGAFDDKY